MRIQFSVVFVCMIALLAACGVIAGRSHKAIGLRVTKLLIALIPPIAGNLIIVRSVEKGLAMIGSYVYCIGMDFGVIALMHFIWAYCNVPKKYNRCENVVYVLCLADIIQLLLNPLFGHAFDMEELIVDGAPYYRIVPYLGQIFHRVTDYGVLAGVLFILVYKTLRTPRIYSERYSVMLVSCIGAGLWQTFYVFSRTPVDRSMIGFGAFGLLAFYFSILYRPMRLLDRMLANIASEMPEALLFFDVSDRCIWANRPALALLQLDMEALDSAPERLDELFGEMELTAAEWSLRRSLVTDGQPHYYILNMHAVMGDRNEAAGSFLSIRDNTEEHLRLKQEFYNATHDSLTALFTREYLYEQIAHILQEHQKTQYLLLFADVKNFKIINDIFSKTFGDFALQQIAGWIRQEMSARAVYGRLGGDTFGICIPKEDFHADAFEEHLTNFTVDDGVHRYQLLMHIGIYEVVQTDMPVSVMFDRAHMALSRIKDEYHTHLAYYDEESRNQVLWAQQISAQLPEAIAQRQIRPYLQPIVDRDGRVVGAEALARWIHPEDGFLAPFRFIPVFEKNGMIVEVDRHIWRCACELLSGWQNENSELFLSVNISPKDFYFLDVIGEITALTEEYHIPPERLRIEITETVMMNNADGRMKILSDFREKGFIVEMDDFGSGYSSLNLLKDMPVDVVKLDMKFLSSSERNPKADIILRNILNLTKDLGMDSLTEGVETDEQYRMLRRMGCKLFQGYCFAKPMPVAEFEAFCAQNRQQVQGSRI